MSAPETLGERGEFGFLAELLPRLASSSALLLGPGDDAAVLALQGPLAVSTDTLVEGVHFRREWSSARDIGRKCVAVNVADIEAMGVTPVALVLGLSAPADTELTWLREFYAGMAEEAERAGVVLAGGDITGARDITLAVTVLGDCGSRRPVTRAGAQPGDDVAVCGELGLAGAGLSALSRGFRSPRAAVERQRCPEPPYGQGVVANDAGAHAMLDVSDGLLADLDHIAAASGVRIDVQRERFDIPDAVRSVAAATGADPARFVLTGGEDHALAATFPAGTAPDGWRVVGSVLPADTSHESDEAQPRVSVDGRSFDGAAGWDHFGARSSR